MYITYNDDGKIKKIFFGNINLLKSHQNFVTIPSGYVINSSTFVDVKTKEFVSCYKPYDYYEITELTDDTPFELEKI